MQDVVEMIYRLFGLVFTAIGVLCEMEWTETIRSTSLLQFWTSRGMFYVFISLFTVREYGVLTYQWSDMRFVLDTIAGILFAVGSAYITMVSSKYCFLYSYRALSRCWWLQGLFCMKKIRDEKMARYVRMLSGFEVRTNRA